MLIFAGEMSKVNHNKDHSVVKTLMKRAEKLASSVLFLVFRLSVALCLFRYVFALLRDEQERDELPDCIEDAFHFT